MELNARIEERHHVMTDYGASLGYYEFNHYTEDWDFVPNPDTTISGLSKNELFFILMGMSNLPEVGE